MTTHYRVKVVHVDKTECLIPSKKGTMHINSAFAGARAAHVRWPMSSITVEAGSMPFQGTVRNWRCDATMQPNGSFEPNYR